MDFPQVAAVNRCDLDTSDGFVFSRLVCFAYRLLNGVKLLCQIKVCMLREPGLESRPEGVPLRDNFKVTCDRIARIARQRKIDDEIPHRNET
jgi:hypothetical protein